MKTTKYNYGEKSLKAPFIIYGDLECLLKKMHWCQNNPEKSYTDKKTKHTPSGYSLFTNCSFDSAKNKLDCYTGKGRIINYEKKKQMIPLTDEENELYECKKLATNAKKYLVLIKMMKMHLNYIIK